MAGLSLIASTRPTFTASPKKLSFPIPEGVQVGDVLLALAMFAAADSFPTPAGWTVVASDSIGIGAMAILARVVDGTEGATLDITPALATNDWMGQMLAYRNGYPGAIVENNGLSGFTTTTNALIGGVSCQQPMNIENVAWWIQPVRTFTPPAGYAVIDTYSTAIAGAAAFLIVTRTTKSSGLLGGVAATLSGNASGVGNRQVLRDRPPVVPTELSDPVPGNIGLLGKDTRIGH